MLKVHEFDRIYKPGFFGFPTVEREGEVSGWTEAQMVPTLIHPVTTGEWRHFVTVLGNRGSRIFSVSLSTITGWGDSTGIDPIYKYL